MPANLTPQYLAAEQRFREAKTNQEKIAALEEMMALIPKHKGTDHMRADIKRRMAKLKEKERTAKGAKKAYEFHVEKEGAAQIAVIGPPNSGKSLLVDHFTAAEPEVADYPFTTRVPLPGMMEYEDIQIQLVDTPPITSDYFEPWLAGIVRNADAVLLVADLTSPGLIEEIEDLKELLAGSKIRLSGLTEPLGEFSVGTVFPRTMIVANKMDVPGAEESLEILEDLYVEFPIIPVSVKDGTGLEELKHRIYDLADIIRVYTKIPGKPADRARPFTLKRGSTLVDLAAMVHKDFVDKMRFARAWGVNKPDGVMISRDQPLEDRDVVELHG